MSKRRESIRTEAGRALFDWFSSDARPLDLYGPADEAAFIRSIESQARAQALRDLTEHDAHPFRWMLDGTPCWCISADEPHDGWVHAPACQDQLREQLSHLVMGPR